jgi:hypothetical protein
MEELETRHTMVVEVTCYVREGRPDLITRFRISPFYRARAEGNIQVHQRLKIPQHSDIGLRGDLAAPIYFR